MIFLKVERIKGLVRIVVKYGLYVVFFMLGFLFADNRFSFVLLNPFEFYKYQVLSPCSLDVLKDEFNMRSFHVNKILKVIEKRKNEPVKISAYIDGVRHCQEKEEEAINRSMEKRTAETGPFDLWVFYVYRDVGCPTQSGYMRLRH